jgi:hypothetical protein
MMTFGGLSNSPSALEVIVDFSHSRWDVDAHDPLASLLSCPGPDWQDSVVKETDSPARLVERYDDHTTRPRSLKWRLRFHAAVLHLRGDRVTRQPFQSASGDVLLFVCAIHLHFPFRS